MVLMAVAGAAAAPTKPHVVWVVADDLGYDDLALTGAGSDVKTPTLSRLAKEGSVLSNYYVNPICTPTRSSFMAGRYPIHLGLQHGVILDSVPEAVPINETLAPQYMKAAGYATHIVGKWHLGFHQKRYTPEARGFDTHMGYYTGNEEYWNHTSPAWSAGNYTALDLHHATATSFEPLTNHSNHYSTIMFAEECEGIIARHPPATPLFLYAPFEAVHGASSCFVKGKPPNCMRPDGDELQAPPKYIEQQAHIANHERRVFGAMLGALDEAVENITLALKAKGMLSSTLLLFTTDNGAPNSHFAAKPGQHATMSNWPLRGGKGQLWEGGIRGTAFVWGAGVQKGANITKLFHCSDWLPTFAGLAGASMTPHQKAVLDGHDIWAALTQTGTPSPRAEILHNIDPLQGAAAIRVGDFKLVVGQRNAGWGPDPSNPAGLPVKPDPEDKGPWLFDIASDPSERVNLYNQSASGRVQGQVEARLEHYRRSMVPCRLCTAKPDASLAGGLPLLKPHVTICTPSPVNESDATYGSQPIMCNPVGVWKPWQKDPAAEE